MHKVDYSKEIGRGTFGTVYMCDDDTICYKHFNREPLSYTEKTIRKIKNLRIHNIYKIYDIVKIKIHNTKYLHGYFAEYCEPVGSVTIKNGIKVSDNKPLIYFPIDYVIRNYYALKDTFEILYKNNIKVVDLHYLNMVFTEKDIMIIDVDNYMKFNPIKKLLGIEKVYDIDQFFFCLLHMEITVFMNDVSVIDFVNYMRDHKDTFIEDIKAYPTLYDFLEDKLGSKKLIK